MLESRGKLCDVKSTRLILDRSLHNAAGGEVDGDVRVHKGISLEEEEADPGRAVTKAVAFGSLCLD